MDKDQSNADELAKNKTLGSQSKNNISGDSSCNKQNNNNNKKGFGLSNYSYIDYVILSSTLSYAISEELNDEDLDFIVVFLSQVTSDLALLRTKRGYDLKKLAASAQQDTSVLDAVSAEGGSEDIIISELGRGKKKYKRVRKKKIKKKKVYV